MSFANLSFETVGGASGQATGWTYTSQAQREIAEFGTALPWENYESGWANDSYLFAFAGIGFDLEQAVFTSTFPAPLLVERFEELWDSNQSYVYGISGVSAQFDAALQLFEDFEQEWFGNESYLFSLSGIATASFDTAPEDFEDFEEGWSAGYLFAFVGVGTDLTADMFGGAADVENFEGVWALMTTV